MRRLFLTTMLLAGMLAATTRVSAFPAHLIDSLRRIVASPLAPDTVRIAAMAKLSMRYSDTSLIEAFHYAEQADALAAKTGWARGKVIAQIALGDCYQFLRQYTEALKHYREAASISTHEPDSNYLKRAVYGILQIYEYVGRRDSQLYYTLRSLQLARAVRDTTFEIHTLQRLGFFFDADGDHWSSVRYLTECQRLLHITLRRNHEALAWANLAQQYGLTGRQDSARHCIVTALNMVLKTNDKSTQATVYLHLADFHQRKRHGDSGIAAATIAVSLAEAAKDIYTLRDAYDLSCRLNEAAGNSAEALDNYRQYIIYRDSAAHEERTLDDAKKILRYQYAQQVEEIGANERQLKVSNRSRLYIILGLAGGIVLLAVLIIFLAKSARQNRKKAATIAAQAEALARQKATVQAALEQKNVLMKEMHHRVKNNLQVISALQQMQANRSNDSLVKEALNVSQNRVLSIAFIHHNLYQHDDLKGVEMNSFVKELAKHILDVCVTGGMNIGVTQDIDMLQLDIDTAVPIGLIINELLTNSCKHAFMQRIAGSIFIKLLESGDGNYLLLYEDDGPGLDTGIDFKKAGSLGLKLIQQLTEQLDGTLRYDYVDSKSRFTLAFKDFDARNRD